MPEKYLADSSISMITDISIDNKIIAEIIFLDQAKYNLEYTQAICAKNQPLFKSPVAIQEHKLKVKADDIPFKICLQELSKMA